MSASFIQLPDVDTEETKSLCLEIAKKSNGVCFLMFSRGKDSLFAWLYLKKYFKKVIPFHCASIPCLKHDKEILDYYEEAMGERILRLVGEEVPMAIPRLMYQKFDQIEALTEEEPITFSKLDILEYLRYALNLPRAWCAVGINAGDSIDRRIYTKKVGGKNAANLTFYPTWAIPRSEMLRCLRNSGLKLSDEYRYSNRTLGGVPSATVNKILREHYPEDYERMLAIYPYAEAKTIREMFLDRIWEERKAQGIVSEDPSEEDDGTDIMPELGMGEEEEES